MRHRGRRLAPGLRGRLLLAVVLAVIVALGALIAAFNVVLARRLDASVNQVLRARAAAELGALATVDGRLTVREAPDDAALDSQVWVFAGRRTLEAPQSARGLDAAARALIDQPRGYRDVPGGQARLFATPVVRGHRRAGTVVTGVSLAPYEHTKHTALVASLILAGALLLAVALAAAWLLSRALRPVARMTTDADEWSERDLDRRFALGEPHDELTHLAATLDRLLDRLAGSLRREQRFSAELSHELRTPLAQISAEAELALRRERSSAAYRRTLERIVASAARMGRAIDTLVAAARAQAQTRPTTADAGRVAADALQACAGVAADRGVALHRVAATGPVRVGADADVVERILVPLIENACRYATTTVRVGVTAGREEVRYTVSDDGPGIPNDERERVFEPGWRGAAAQRDGGPAGAGLGLALARRLAQAVGGEIHVEPAATGACLTVRLPGA